MSRHRATDWTHTDETSLIKQVQEGNQEASAALRARYVDKVAHCIQRYGAKHEDEDIEEIEAEDIEAIVQGAWQDIQQRLSTYDPTHTPFAALVEYCTTFVTPHSPYNKAKNCISGGAELWSDGPLSRWRAVAMLLPA